jgi:hypothetical protein
MVCLSTSKETAGRYNLTRFRPPYFLKVTLRQFIPDVFTMSQEGPQIRYSREVFRFQSMATNSSEASIIILLLMCLKFEYRKMK